MTVNIDIWLPNYCTYHANFQKFQKSRQPSTTAYETIQISIKDMKLCCLFRATV